MTPRPVMDENTWLGSVEINTDMTYSVCVLPSCDLTLSVCIVTQKELKALNV